MSPVEDLRIAARALRANKLRSALTAPGLRIAAVYRRQNLRAVQNMEDFNADFLVMLERVGGGYAILPACRRKSGRPCPPLLFSKLGLHVLLRGPAA
jgi:hypothetical protein